MFKVTHSYNADNNMMFNRTMEYNGKTMVEFCTQVRQDTFKVSIDAGHPGPSISHQVTVISSENINEQLQKQVALVEELFINKFNCQIKIPKWPEINHGHRP